MTSVLRGRSCSTVVGGKLKAEVPSLGLIRSAGITSWHGWLEKRNDRGTWQKRYWVVSPTTVCWYFDSDSTNSAPIGMIDLSVFRSCEICRATEPEAAEKPGSSVLRLSCALDPNSRAYYLADDKTGGFAQALAYGTAAARLKALEERVVELEGELVSVRKAARTTLRQLEEERRQLATEQRERLELTNSIAAARERLGALRKSEVYGVAPRGMAAVRTPRESLRINSTAVRETIDALLDEVEESRTKIETLSEKRWAQQTKLNAEIEKMRKGYERALEQERERCASVLQNAELEASMQTASLRDEVRVLKSSLEQQSHNISELRKVKAVLVREVKKRRAQLQQRSSCGENDDDIDTYDIPTRADMATQTESELKPLLQIDDAPTKSRPRTAKNGLFSSTSAGKNLWLFGGKSLVGNAKSS